MASSNYGSLIPSDSASLDQLAASDPIGLAWNMRRDLQSEQRARASQVLDAIRKQQEQDFYAKMIGEETARRGQTLQYGPGVADSPAAEYPAIRQILGEPTGNVIQRYLANTGKVKAEAASKEADTLKGLAESGAYDPKASVAQQVVSKLFPGTTAGMTPGTPLSVLQREMANAPEVTTQVPGADGALPMTVKTKVPPGQTAGQAAQSVTGQAAQRPTLSFAINKYNASMRRAGWQATIAPDGQHVIIVSPNGTKTPYKIDEFTNRVAGMK